MGIYMKYGDMTGDATQKIRGKNLIKGTNLDADGWIDISDFKWTVDRQITTRAGGSNTRDAKQAAIKEFTIKKDADATTTQLLHEICYATKGVSCTIIFVRTGNPDVIYLQYIFSNVFITHIDVSVEQEKPVESVQMNFTKVEMVFSGADTSNISGSPKRFEYELKQPASTPTPTH